MSKKPEHFRYGPYDFDIIYRDDLVERLEEMGSTHFNHLEVFIDSRMKPQMLKETLCHELLHVLLRDIGFFPDQDSEEKFIRLLSPRVMQMFCDNQELSKFLFLKGEQANGNPKKRK